MYQRDIPLHQNDFVIKTLMKSEKSFSPACRTSPEGWWNQNFQHPPSRDEVITFLMKLDSKILKAEQRRKNRFNQVITGEAMCCLATLSIDQNYIQVVDLIKEIVTLLRNTKYKWYDQPILRAEFFSDKDGKWNPHIHILNKRGLNNGVPPSVIKQALTKKLKGDKYQIYRVHACERPLTSGEDYINGVKKTIKQENVKKDAEYRKENNLQDIYYLDE